MSIRFIQQAFNHKPFFIGYYDDLENLYQLQGYIVTNTFGSSYRVQETLEKQGWISLLCDDFDLEYRIEVA